jgi:hypothetical protein
VEVIVYFCGLKIICVIKFKFLVAQSKQFVEDAEGWLINACMTLCIYCIFAFFLLKPWHNLMTTLLPVATAHLKIFAQYICLVAKTFFLHFQQKHP